VSDGESLRQHRHFCYDCGSTYECEKHHSYGSGSLDDGTKRPGGRCCGTCREWAVGAIERLEVKRRERLYR